MRLCVASSAAAEKLVNDRSTPGVTSDVTMKSRRSCRRTAANTSAPTALITACAPGYAGSGAVLPPLGNQFDVGVVSGLSSAPASRIAVTGRQRVYVYLAS